jgi:hypothetical protein
MKILTSFLFLTIVGASTYRSFAGTFGGVEFPQGVSSFADAVERYEPLHSGGPAPTAPPALQPTEAIGIPNYTATREEFGFVSLGRGGLLELRFVDNVLTNSGNESNDLWIFEIGDQVEDTFVAVRPTPATALLLSAELDANGDGFYEVGKVFGGTSGIDLDQWFLGFAAGKLRFDAVQLIDDPNEGGASGQWVGADIDAVGAISSIAIPEPTAMWLLVSGVVVVALGRTTKTKT